MRFAKPSTTVSATARAKLELGPACKPAPRHPDAATSIVFCNANVRDSYRPGDGDSRRTSVRRVIATTELLSGART